MIVGLTYSLRFAEYDSVQTEIPFIQSLTPCVDRRYFDSTNMMMGFTYSLRFEGVNTSTWNSTVFREVRPYPVVCRV